MASELNTPPVLLKPFADSGDKNIIPETATGTQQASLDEGFPPVTSLPLTQGGIPPERKDFNGLGNLLSKQYFYLQNGGRFTFNQDVSDAIGGYPQNATLWFKDEALGISYPVTSLINNNTYNFVTTPSYIDGIKWKRVIDSFPSTQITNCLTEIPQDIKLTLSSGTLTLEAGSKVYVPNGAGVFDTVTIASDSQSTFTTSSNQRMFFWNNTGGYIQSEQLANIYSGSTAPTGSGIIYWYDTTNNLIKRSTDGGSTWGTDKYSLPLGLFSVSNNNISTIDQVFNGFGYIGSTVFALPGVKGVRPTGRNADGTLKNIIVSISSVLVNTSSSTGTLNIGLNSDSIYAVDRYTYDETKNSNYNLSNNYVALINAGTVVKTSGVITSLTPKTAFHAVDYNDFSDLSDKVDTNYNSLNSSKANVSLNNLNSTGQMIIDSQNGTISNCILEIPQNIKCSIENNVPVLKAGSIVTLDGSSYSTQTTTADSSNFIKTDVDDKYFLTMTGNPSSVTLNAVYPINKNSSGNSSGYPTQNLDSSTTYYNTDDKKWYRYSSGSWVSLARYPLAVIERSNGNWQFVKDSNGNDMIFNGACFLGHHAVVYPGVKALRPQGFNEDGSLKNNPTNTSSLSIVGLTVRDNSVCIYNPSTSANRLYYDDYSEVASQTFPSGYYVVAYDKQNNINMYNPGNYRDWVSASGLYVKLIDVVYDGTTVTDFTIRQPMRLATTEMLDKAMMKDDWIRVSSTPPADADPNKFYYTSES